MSDAVDNAASGTDDYDGNDKEYDLDRKHVDDGVFIVLLQMRLTYARNNEYDDADDAGTQLMNTIMIVMIADHDIF